MRPQLYRERGLVVLGMARLLYLDADEHCGNERITNGDSS
jgi:hypothetical protein